MYIELRRIILLTITIEIIIAKTDPNNDILNRQKRVVLQYPYNSATGILVALSVPLGLDNRNIFMSYNFEANYNMPITASDVFPGPLNRLEPISNDVSEGEARNGNGELEFGNDKLNSTTEIEPKSTTVKFISSPKAEGLLSRNNIYRLLIKKLNREGHWNGKACLLRTICDAAANPLHEHNGILGDIIHIILTPSSSEKEEKLHPQFYFAEINGKKNNCASYDAKCPDNILDYFSEFIYH